MNDRGFFWVLGVTATVLIAAAIALQATAAELKTGDRYARTAAAW